MDTNGLSETLMLSTWWSEMVALHQKAAHLPFCCCSAFRARFSSIALASLSRRCWGVKPSSLVFTAFFWALFWARWRSTSLWLPLACIVDNVLNVIQRWDFVWVKEWDWDKWSRSTFRSSFKPQCARVKDTHHSCMDTIHNWKRKIRRQGRSHWE